MKTTKETKQALAPYRARNNGGRVPRFATTLPVIKVTAATDAALRSTARAFDVSIADVVRHALAAYLDVPAELPTLDTTPSTKGTKS